MSRLPSNVQQLSAVSAQAQNLISGADSAQRGREAIAAQKAMQQERIQADKEQAEASRAQAAKMKAQEQAFQSAEGAKDRAAAERRHEGALALSQEQLKEQKYQSDVAAEKEQAQNAMAAQINQLETAEADLQSRIENTFEPEVRAQLQSELEELRSEHTAANKKLVQVNLFAGKTAQEVEQLTALSQQTLIDLENELGRETDFGSELGSSAVGTVVENFEQSALQLTEEGVRGAAGTFGRGVLGVNDVVNSVFGILGSQTGFQGRLSADVLRSIAETKVGQQYGFNEEYLSKFRDAPVSAILRDEKFREAIELEAINEVGSNLAVALSTSIKQRTGKEVDAGALADDINSVMRFVVKKPPSEGGAELKEHASQAEAAIKQLSEQYQISSTTMAAAMKTMGDELKRTGGEAALAASSLIGEGGETGRQEGAGLLFGLVEDDFSDTGINEVGARIFTGNLMQSLGKKLANATQYNEIHRAQVKETREAIREAASSFRGEDLSSERRDEIMELFEGAGLGSAAKDFADALEDYDELAAEAEKLGITPAAGGLEGLVDAFGRGAATQTADLADLAARQTSFQERMPDRVTTGVRDLVEASPEEAARIAREKELQDLLTSLAEAPVRQRDN